MLLRARARVSRGIGRVECAIDAVGSDHRVPAAPGAAGRTTSGCEARSGGGAWLEVVAVLAIANVEVVPNDREPHRVGAIEQLAVFHGLEAEIRQDVRCAPSVPAQAMSVFGLH